MLAMKAFWLSIVALGTCNLANIRIGDAAPAAVSDNVQSFGLFTYSKSRGKVPENANTGNNETTTALQMIESEIMKEIGSCHALDPSFFVLDGKFRTARTAGIAVMMLGLFVVIVMWARACKSISKPLWKATGICVLLCTILEGLTLLILRAGVCSGNNGSSLIAAAMDSDAVTIDCKIARGAGATIAACTFWFATGISMVFLPSEIDVSWTSIKNNHPHADSEDDDNRGEEDEYESELQLYPTWESSDEELLQSPKAYIV